MWGDNPNACFKSGGQNPYGDFQLEYVRLLWGDEKLDDTLRKKIAELQKLRYPPAAHDPDATPTGEQG